MGAACCLVGRVGHGGRPISGWEGHVKIGEYDFMIGKQNLFH